MRISFLAVEFRVIIYVILMVVIFYGTITRYRSNKNYVISSLGSSIGLAIASILELDPKYISIPYQINRLLEIVLYLSAFFSVIPLGLEFYRKTEEKPEARKQALTGLIIFAIFFIPMICFSIYLYLAE